MENKNKIIILVLVVVIAALLVGLAATMSNVTKKDTKLAFKSNATLTEGDSIKFKLTDGNGTVLANQTVNITITDKNQTSDYHSVVTNNKGFGTLKLDKKPGKYNVTVTYAGNDNYTGCNATKKIKIEKKEVVETQTESSSSASSADSTDTSGYTYSRQKGGYVRDDGEWSSDSRGNDVYTYKGDDGVIYERYYDSSGKEISANDYFR